MNTHRHQIVHEVVFAGHAVKNLGYLAGLLAFWYIAKTKMGNVIFWLIRCCGAGWRLLIAHGTVLSESESRILTPAGLATSLIPPYTVKPVISREKTDLCPLLIFTALTPWTNSTPAKQLRPWPPTCPAV